MMKGDRRYKQYVVEVLSADGRRKRQFSFQGLPSGIDVDVALAGPGGLVFDRIARRDGISIREAMERYYVHDIKEYWRSR